MTPVGPIIYIPSHLNLNRIMTPIVVFVNLMSVIEVIPKDLTIVESFGHQLPTLSLVSPMFVRPQSLQIKKVLFGAFLCDIHHPLGSI